MAKAVYVYRLVVTLPEGSDEPGWQPPGWVPMEVFGEDGPDQQGFRWPAKRHCLSMSTAQRWARTLRGWGAEVEIVRSSPVAW